MLQSKFKVKKTLTERGYQLNLPPDFRVAWCSNYLRAVTLPTMIPNEERPQHRELHANSAWVHTELGTLKDCDAQGLRFIVLESNHLQM